MADTADSSTLARRPHAEDAQDASQVSAAAGARDTAPADRNRSPSPLAAGVHEKQSPHIADARDRVEHKACDMYTALSKTEARIAEAKGGGGGGGGGGGRTVTTPPPLASTDSASTLGRARARHVATTIAVGGDGGGGATAADSDEEDEEADDEDEKDEDESDDEAEEDEVEEPGDDDEDSELRRRPDATDVDDSAPPDTDSMLEQVAHRLRGMEQQQGTKEDTEGSESSPNRSRSSAREPVAEAAAVASGEEEGEDDDDDDNEDEDEGEGEDEEEYEESNRGNTTQRMEKKAPVEVTKVEESAEDSSETAETPTSERTSFMKDSVQSLKKMSQKSLKRSHVGLVPPVPPPQPQSPPPPPPSLSKGADKEADVKTHSEQSLVFTEESEEPSKEPSQESLKYGESEHRSKWSTQSLKSSQQDWHRRDRSSRSSEQSLHQQQDQVLDQKALDRETIKFSDFLKGGIIGRAPEMEGDDMKRTRSSSPRREESPRRWDRESSEESASGAQATEDETAAPPPLRLRDSGRPRATAVVRVEVESEDEATQTPLRMRRKDFEEQPDEYDRERRQGGEGGEWEGDEQQMEDDAETPGEVEEFAGLVARLLADRAVDIASERAFADAEEDEDEDEGTAPSVVELEAQVQVPQRPIRSPRPKKGRAPPPPPPPEAQQSTWTQAPGSSSDVSPSVSRAVRVSYAVHAQTAAAWSMLPTPPTGAVTGTQYSTRDYRSEDDKETQGVGGAEEEEEEDEECPWRDAVRAAVMSCREEEEKKKAVLEQRPRHEYFTYVSTLPAVARGPRTGFLGIDDQKASGSRAQTDELEGEEDDDDEESSSGMDELLVGAGVSGVPRWRGRASTEPVYDDEDYEDDEDEGGVCGSDGRRGRAEEGEEDLLSSQPASAGREAGAKAAALAASGTARRKTPRSRWERWMRRFLGGLASGLIHDEEPNAAAGVSANAATSPRTTGASHSAGPFRGRLLQVPSADSCAVALSAGPRPPRLLATRQRAATALARAAAVVDTSRAVDDPSSSGGVKPRRKPEGPATDDETTVSMVEVGHSASSSFGRLAATLRARTLPAALTSAAQGMSARMGKRSKEEKARAREEKDKEKRKRRDDRGSGRMSSAEGKRDTEGRDKSGPDTLGALASMKRRSAQLFRRTLGLRRGEGGCVAAAMGSVAAPEEATSPGGSRYLSESGVSNEEAPMEEVSLGRTMRPDVVGGGSGAGGGGTGGGVGAGGGGSRRGSCGVHLSPSRGGAQPAGGGADDDLDAATAAIAQGDDDALAHAPGPRRRLRDY